MDRSSNAPSLTITTVPSPGTAVQLPLQYVVEGLPITVTNQRNSTGNFYLGFTAAQAQGAATRKVIIPGQSLQLYLDNTNRIWVDADNSTDELETEAPLRP